MNTPAMLESLPPVNPTASEEAIREFLLNYAYPHIHLMSNALGFTGRYFGADVNAAVQFAMSENAECRNVYWTANIVRDGTNRKPGKPDITAARWAHVDCDPNGLTWDKGRVAAQMQQASASLIVNSGRGLQSFWRLDAECRDHAAIEAVNRGLAERFDGGDNCHNVDRAMRLVGTVNWPDDKKRAAGAVPALATVLHEQPQRYGVAALAAQFPASVDTGNNSESEPLPPHFKYSGMSDDQLIGRIAADPVAGPLWRGEVPKGADRSQEDFRLACHLVEFCRTPEKAEAFFRMSALDPAKRTDKAKARNYVERTIGQALAKVWAEQPAKLFENAPADGYVPARMQVVSQIPQAQPVPAFPALISASDFAGKPVPERQWICDPLIPEGVVSDLTADGGTGKSLLALQLAVARASGGQWIGKAVKAGATIYLAAEDDTDELHRRLADICRETRTSLDGLGSLHILPMFGHDARLAGLAGKNLEATPLYAHLHGLINSSGAGLIIVDTRADTFGGNEVERSHVMHFVTLLKKLANDHGASVLLISHPSRAGQALGDGQSGSTAWGNAVRSRLYLTRDSDSDTLMLATKKSNYGPRDTAIRLQWRAGCFVSLGDMSNPMTRLEMEAPIEKEFMELLIQFNRDGRKVSPAMGSNYAPKLFAEAKGLPGKKKQYAAAMQRLLEQSRIKNEISGSASKQTNNLVAVF